MKKILSVLLTFILVMSIYSSLVTFAETTDTVKEIVIEQSDTMSELYKKFGKQSMPREGETLIVTGKKTNMDGTLFINCPENARVIWKATLQGKQDKNKESLIKLGMDNGSFEVAAGGSIKATGKDCVAIGVSMDSTGTITVSGGTVEASGKGEYTTAILGQRHSNNNMTVAVTDGKIIGTISAIRVFYSSNIEISGGLVTGKGEGLPTVYIEDGTLTMTRGTIKATGKGDYVAAIGVMNGKVILSGGTVETTGKEIEVYDKGTVQRPFAESSDNTEGDIKVKLTCQTADAAICYTFNGKDPTTSSKSVKSGRKITLKKTTTLKFMATKKGYKKSAIVKKKYIVKTKKPSVKNVPRSKSVEKGKKIQLTAPKDAVLYYTVNGKNPTDKTKIRILSGKSKNIKINKKTTLRVIAKKKGCEISKIITSTYTPK